MARLAFDHPFRDPTSEHTITQHQRQDMHRRLPPFFETATESHWYSSVSNRSDVPAETIAGNNIERSKERRRKNGWMVVAFVVATMTLFLLSSDHPQQTSSHHGHHYGPRVRSSFSERRRTERRSTKESPITNGNPTELLADPFPSLTQSLQSFELVALYFAAAWCPMSTPVTKLLDTTFRDILVSNTTTFTILFVSSDTSQADLQSYPRPGWQVVQSDSERKALKRQFRTCAKREMSDLGIPLRNAEIPHLILLTRLPGSEPQGQHSFHVLKGAFGMADVQKYGGTGAIGYWQSLRQRMLEQEQRDKNIAVAATSR